MAAVGLALAALGTHTRISPRWLPTSSLDPAAFEAKQIVVPTLAVRWRTRSEWKHARLAMFAAGLYPGVDYIVKQNDGQADGDNGDSSVSLIVQPAYPLIDELEREWPVLVNSTVSPRWMDPAAYNALTACFALGTALGGLALALLFSVMFTFSFIPSASMEPAILPRDVLLVEKITPRLGLTASPGSLVLFSPPPALQQIVRDRAAATIGDAKSRRDVTYAVEHLLFIKRVAGIGGDSVRVDPSIGVIVKSPSFGESIFPGSAVPLQNGYTSFVQDTVPSREYFVLGDNADVSIDSRYWGCLPQDQVVGRPLLRVWPLSRFGPVPGR
eukprot:scaffold82532_cov37-Tisochrysis_lutea.AAC.1